MPYFIPSFILFTLLWIAPATTFGQEEIIVNIQTIKVTKERTLIIYHPERKLSFSDFKGNPPAITPGVAATYSGIKMAYAFTKEANKTTIDIELTCYFNPLKSWMKKEGKTTNVLAHEQGHFDLTYIQFSRLAQAISESTFSSNWKTELLNLRQKNIDELEQIQKHYDKTTHHGTIKEEQEKYLELISSQLAEIALNP